MASRRRSEGRGFQSLIRFQAIIYWSHSPGEGLLQPTAALQGKSAHCLCQLFACVSRQSASMCYVSLCICFSSVFLSICYHRAYSFCRMSWRLACDNIIIPYTTMPCHTTDSRATLCNLGTTTTAHHSCRGAFSTKPNPVYSPQLQAQHTHFQTQYCQARH